jgi:hypothetical protein
MLEARINSLMGSLDRRKNQKFDPMMLRMAQGFLAPTKSGSFFESLGNVSGGVAEEQAKQQLQDENVGKMQLELGQKMYDLQRQSAAQDMLGGALGKNPAMAQGTPQAMPQGAPVAPQMPQGNTQVPQDVKQAPQGEILPSTQGTQQVVNAIARNPNIMNEITMTPQVVAAISSLDPALGKIAESVLNSQIKKAELMQKRYNINSQGDQFDTFTGDMVKKGQRSIDVASPTDPDRTIKMPVEVAEQYNKLDFNDPRAVNTFLRSHGLGAYASGPEKAGGTGDGLGITGGTKLERETEAKITEKRQGAKVEQNQKDVTSMQSAAEAAQGMMQDARTIYGYASNPKTSSAFGLISKAGIGPAILSAAEEGIRVGPYNIGVNNLTTRILQAKGTQDEVNAALALGRNISQLELGYTRMFLKGEGQITEGERAIVRRIPPGITDSPKTAMLKSEMIMARSTFDTENNSRYQAWAEKNPNGYYQEYKKDPSYMELTKHYDNKIKQLDKKYL